MNVRKTLAALLIVLIAALAPLAAQEDKSVSYRFDQGDQMYFFNAGPYLSLFIWTPAKSPELTDFPMKLGGNASMGFEAFLNRTTSLGAEIGYTFAKARDTELYTSVPIMANLSYYLISGNVDIPVTLGLGLAYNKYKDSSFFSPLIKPEASVIWNFNDNWGLGTDISYFFTPEIKFGSYSDQTAFNNALTFKLSLQYKQ